MPYNAEARIQAYRDMLQVLETLPTSQEQIDLLEDFIWEERIELKELPRSEPLMAAKQRLHWLQNPPLAFQPLSLFTNNQATEAENAVGEGLAGLNIHG